MLSGIFSNRPCLAQTCARSLSARRPRISCTSTQIFPEERRDPTQRRIFAEHPLPFPLGPSTTTSMYKLSHAWYLAPEPVRAFFPAWPGKQYRVISPNSLGGVIFADMGRGRSVDYKEFEYLLSNCRLWQPPGVLEPTCADTKE